MDSFFQTPLNTGKAFLEQALGWLHPHQPKFSSQEFEFGDCFENVMVFVSVHGRRPQPLNPFQIYPRLPKAISEDVLQLKLRQNLSFNRIDHHDNLRHCIIRELPNLLLIDTNRVGGGLVNSFFNDRRWTRGRSGRKR